MIERININLLPPERRKKIKKAKVNWPLLGGVAVGGGLVVLLILAASFIYIDLGTKKAERDQLKNEIALYNTQLGELKRLEARKQELSRTNDVLVSIVRDKVAFSKILNEVRKNTPVKVWITNMSIDSSKKIKISGYTLEQNYKFVAAFLLNLEKSSMFDKPVLEYSKTAVLNKQDVVQFEITMTLVPSEATVYSNPAVINVEKKKG